MGQCLSSFGQFGCTGEKEIISDGSLAVVREVVTELRSNVQIIGHAWLFRTGAAVHQGVVQELYLGIKKGDVRSVRALLDAGWRLEASQALYTFLAKLQQPLIPFSIQCLVLDDTGNVPVELVATDVLGLMKQELPEKHLELASLLLHLLDTVIKFSPADELRGNTLPISMLPLFFNIESQHMHEWRRIATIFVELIRQASREFESPIIDNVHVGETHSDLTEALNAYLADPVDVLQNVTRRYLLPVGFRGDCNNLEVYQRNNSNRVPIN